MSKPFANILRHLLDTRGWEIQDLAEKTQLSRQAVSRHINAHNFPHRATRKKYALAFGITVDELDELWRRPAPAPNPAIPSQSISTSQNMKGTTTPYIEGWAQASGDKHAMIPVFNGVHAGSPVDYESTGIHDGVADDYIPRMGLGVDDPHAFAVIVIGDSMTPEFQEGDRIVCSPETPVNDGDVVFVRFGQERDNTCTLKRVYDMGDKVALEPDNRRHPIIRAPKVHIVGMARVVAKWTRYV